MAREKGCPGMPGHGARAPVAQGPSAMCLGGSVGDLFAQPEVPQAASHEEGVAVSH